MDRLVILAVPLFCALSANAQGVKKMLRKVPGTEKPTCSPGSTCFSGEVSAGGDFRKILNTNLELVLKRPSNVVLERGWFINIVPRRPEGDCDEFTDVVNGPYRAHKQLYIDMSYGWTAEMEVKYSPRVFQFVTNCTDFRIEWERLMIVLGSTPSTPEQYDKTIAQLGSNAQGKGRFWITDSRISHADDGPDDVTLEGLKLGRIEWMKFSVELLLPRQ